MEETFYLLGGGQMVLRKVMEQVILNAKIRTAEYCETQRYYGKKDEWAYEQVYFWLDRNDDFLYIEDYEKSLQKGNQEKYQREQEVLLIRKERLTELFHEEMQKLLKATRAFPSNLVGNIEKQLMKILREEQLIYQIYRSDSRMGRPAIEYPVCIKYSINNDYDYDSGNILYMVNFENVVQINTAHPYVVEHIYRRMEETETETEVVPERYKIEDINGNNICATKIYEKRRTFIRGKSLYKK
jgi:hypothetical protein